MKTEKSENQLCMFSEDELEQLGRESQEAAKKKLAEEELKLAEAELWRILGIS